MLERFSHGGVQERVAGSALDQHDIYDQWIGFIARNLYTLNLDSVSDAFSISAASRSANKFTLARFNTVAGKSRLNRTVHDIVRDSQDRYVAHVSIRGSLVLSQMGRSRECVEGTLTLVSAAEPMEHLKLGDNDTICFLLPRSFVDHRLVRGEDVCVRPVDLSQGLGHLVLSTITNLHHDAAFMSDPEFESAARVVGDMVFLLLGSSADLTCGDTSVRKGNLARAKRVIRSQLENCHLELADVADQCGISLSYLHNLFRDDGRTAREYLQFERLQRARQLLQMPNKTVTEVALACGFSNVSQFSTSFKKAFHLSPSEVLRRNGKVS